MLRCGLRRKGMGSQSKKPDVMTMAMTQNQSAAASLAEHAGTDGHGASDVWLIEF